MTSPLRYSMPTYRYVKRRQGQLLSSDLSTTDLIFEGRDIAELSVGDVVRDGHEEWRVAEVNYTPGDAEAEYLIVLEAAW